MLGVQCQGRGDCDVLQLEEVPHPEMGATQMLVRVKAAGLNRADILQRKGFYPPPPGASPLLGLELAGIVEKIGAEVVDFAVGDPICALVDGGAHAEYAVVEPGLAIPMQPDWTFHEAAAIPEACFTAHRNLLMLGGLRKGESILIHAGSSGVGSMAIQMSKRVGAQVITTAGADWKLETCLALGADFALDYRQQSLESHECEGLEKGVDMVLDFLGAAYLKANLRILKNGGRLVVVGLLRGAREELDLGLLLRKGLRIQGSVMRGLPLAMKQDIKDSFLKRWSKELSPGELWPVVHKVFPISEVRDAHRTMEDRAHFGKLVLTFP